MKKQFTIALAVSGIAMIMASCSSSAPEPKKEEAPAGPKIPGWVLNPNIEGGLAAAECVVATNDFSLDQTQATAQGRASIAKQLGVKVQAMDKTYQNKTTTAGGTVSGNTFESVSKQVSEQYLKGSRSATVEYVILNGTNNLCVHVVLDPQATKKLFDQIVEQSNNQVSAQDKDVLYQEFKAAQAQDELSNAVSN